MDRKLNSDSQWFASPLVDLSKFKEEAIAIQNSLKNLVPVEKIADLASIIEARAGCSEETIEGIFEDVLTTSQFLTNSAHFDKTYDELKIIQDPLNTNLLYTHKNLSERDEYMDSSRQRKSAYISSLRYDRYNIDAISSSESSSINPECEEDIVILVDVIIPYNRPLSTSELRTSRLLKPQTKLKLRGENTLYNLRSFFACLSDAVIPLEDGKELENADFSLASAELYPSSFIFIHDTFYLDMQHETSIDISEPIRQFMAKRKIFDQTYVKDMREAKIIDLKLRLGQPYVFQHSGNCEHLLIFHDLRMMNYSDNQEIKSYPWPIFEKAGERKCDACHRENAAYVVEKSEILPNTFTNFCETCFVELNFTSGIKNNSFRAWPVIALNNLRP